MDGVVMITTVFELNSEFTQIVYNLRTNAIDLRQALDRLTDLASEAASCGLPFDVHEAEHTLRVELGLPVRDDDA